MKKSMKKRSLMSAVAMLVVSAIVLSSATFAWFSLGQTAQVDQLQLNVTSASGVELSVDGTNYYSVITKPIFEAQLAKTLDSIHLSPVDWNGTSFRTATAANDVLGVLADADANTQYLSFDLFIRVGSAGTVNFSQTALLYSTLGGTAADVLYCSIKDPSNNVTVYGGDVSAAYQSIKQTSAGTIGLVSGIVTNAPDLNANFVSANNLKDFTLAYAAAGVQKITVSVWVEGQDVNCAGSYPGGTCDLNLLLGFVADAASTTP